VALRKAQHSCTYFFSDFGAALVGLRFHPLVSVSEPIPEMDWPPMLPGRWSLIQLDEELSTDLDVTVRLEREWVAAVAMVPWDLRGSWPGAVGRPQLHSDVRRIRSSVADEPSVKHRICLGAAPHSPECLGVGVVPYIPESPRYHPGSGGITNFMPHPWHGMEAPGL